MVDLRDMFTDELTCVRYWICSWAKWMQPTTAY